MFGIYEGANKHIIFKFFGIKIKLSKAKNNKIFIIKNGKRISVRKIKGIDVKFIGSNSVFEIGVNDKSEIQNNKITIGDDSFVSIKSCLRLKDSLIYSGCKNSKIIIGKNFYCNGLEFYNSEESNVNLFIGDDCMIAKDVLIRTNDGHSIFQYGTKNFLNDKITDIIIEDHVWLASRAMVLKNSTVVKNSIVAAGAVYTQNAFEKYKKGNYKNGVIFAGNPAKVIRDDIDWDIRKRFEFME